MNKDSLVYRHISSKGEVFYIGIGNSKRPYKKLNRSQFWKNIVDKYGYSIEILAENLTREDAEELEILLISIYGRRDLKTGTLVNLTDGGRGTLGHTVSEEHKLIVTKAGTNRKHSVETKKKMSEYAKNRTKEHLIKITNKIRKPVLQYTLDGIFIKEWTSLKEAESDNYGFIRGCINGTQKKAGEFLWKYKTT